MEAVAGQNAETNKFKNRVIVIVVLVLACLAYFGWPGQQANNKGRGSIRMISKTPGRGLWLTIGPALSDIAAINFEQEKGIALSLEGDMAYTNDGGKNWQAQGKVPLGTGEQITSALIKPGHIYLSSIVDESNFTGLYEFNNQGWQALNVNNGEGYGGIQASDKDMIVGSQGLVGHFDGHKWGFSQLPEWGQVNLYGVSQQDSKVVAVGEYGLSAISYDMGRSWLSLNNSKDNSTLYSCAINGEDIFVGGANGTFQIISGNKEVNRVKIVGLRDSATIFSIYAQDKIIVAAGGDNAGFNPFIVYSNDGGETFSLENMAGDYGRIVKVAKTPLGLIAATIDGHILVRQIL